MQRSLLNVIPEKNNVSKPVQTHIVIKRPNIKTVNDFPTLVYFGLKVSCRPKKYCRCK